MAIEQRIVNGSLTEIYINGGGYFMTQSYPTNFHVFLTRKILTAAESIADWMEVSEAEKARIEATDAAWERPPQRLIDQWDTKGRLGYTQFAKYNNVSGFFEYRNVKDITTSEAITILDLVKSRFVIDFSDVYNYGIYWPNSIPLLRVFFLPKLLKHDSIWYNFDRAFYNQSNLKSAFLGGESDVSLYGSGLIKTFYGCKVLEEIFPAINLQNIYNSNNVLDAFYGCENLESVKIKNLVVDISFASCKKIDYDSLNFCVSNAANTAPITITVHADIYAALQGEGGVYPFNGGSREEWMKLYSDALARQITFAAA